MYADSPSGKLHCTVDQLTSTYRLEAALTEDKDYHKKHHMSALRILALKTKKCRCMIALQILILKKK